MKKQKQKLQRQLRGRPENVQPPFVDNPCRRMNSKASVRPPSTRIKARNYLRYESLQSRASSVQVWQRARVLGVEVVLVRGLHVLSREMKRVG